MRNQKRVNEELNRRVKEKTQEFELANRELARLSYIDELTELYNRRYFNKCLDKEWQRLQRIEQPLALLLCDIDFFKQYNDTYGHQAGDYAIAQVAAVILRNVRRAAEIAARYGGEEFAVILPQTDLERATLVAEKIRKSLVKRNIPHSNSTVKDRLSMSIGVASVVPSNAESPALLLSLADEALYISKNSGRDRVFSVNQIEGSPDSPVAGNRL
ncbi:GGDEF domain-containing protein [Desulfogranum marinum]|uniref:GGDEF domain-containing protein n=1 Tax=Desulfogranum marinum TaxID=453220 RepID=UPI001965ABC5|nr:GGDEF domain-containing protein [Desulfogranum marinum]MBM9514847.1 GGDEF domain-containing protein [Desulfogranum marinum]